MGTGPRLLLTHGGYSALGRRANNEDSHAFLGGDDPARGALVVVADGMGGHAAGEVASRLALEVVSERFAASSGADTAGWLKAAVEAANAAVHGRAAADPDLAGMGTTFTALAFRGSRAVVAHVGDSRAILFRDRTSTRLTRDHSVRAELGIPEGDASVPHPPHAHMLTRALGAAASVLVDVTDPSLEIRAGDVFLLCSDGLTGTVSEADMLVELTRNDPETAARRLAELALERGGTDNVTVEIVKVEAVEGAGVLSRLKRALGRGSSAAPGRDRSEAPERGEG